MPESNKSGIRRGAMLEAIDYLEYRIAVCRDAEEKFSVAKGYPPISSATERSARMELELAIKEIAKLGNMQKRSRAYRTLVAERQTYIKAHTFEPAGRRALSDAQTGEQGNG